MLTSSLLAWVSSLLICWSLCWCLTRSIRACMVGRLPVSSYRILTLELSSAKDQLTGANVAIKKIMKPFNAPVLSKRTYRELKLLKHIQHENVSCRWFSLLVTQLLVPQIISLSDVFISPLEDLSVHRHDCASVICLPGCHTVTLWQNCSAQIFTGCWPHDRWRNNLFNISCTKFSCVQFSVQVCWYWAVIE